MESEIKKLIAKLKEYGLSDKDISKLIIIAQEEFFDQMKEDLKETDDQELTKLNNEISKANIADLDKEGAEEFLKKILVKIYGFKSKRKIQDFLINYLGECVEDAEKIQDFYKKYSQGDPETLKKVLEMQNHPDFNNMQDIVNSIKDK